MIVRSLDSMIHINVLFLVPVWCILWVIKFLVLKVIHYSISNILNLVEVVNLCTCMSIYNIFYHQNRIGYLNIITTINGKKMSSRLDSSQSRLDQFENMFNRYNPITLAVQFIEGTFFLTVSCLQLCSNSTAFSHQLDRQTVVSTLSHTVWIQSSSNDVYCQCAMGTLYCLNSVYSIR